MVKKKSEPAPWDASMKPEQLEKRLAWLDENRRKEAEAVARLNERVEAMEETRAKGASQIKGVMSEITRLGAIAVRITQFDEALARCDCRAHYSIRRGPGKAPAGGFQADRAG